MSKRSNSNITRIKSQALNDMQLKAAWMNKPMNKPVKKLRTFNQTSNSMHGKIVIDKNTVIEYDYTKETPVTNIKKLDKTKDQRETFIIPKYPILKSIVNEIPNGTNDNTKEMELYLVRDLNQAVIWKNNEFEYHT